MFVESVMDPVLISPMNSVIVMEANLMNVKYVVETEFQKDGLIVIHHQKKNQLTLKKIHQIKSKKELKKMVVNITTLGSE